METGIKQVDFTDNRRESQGQKALSPKGKEKTGLLSLFSVMG